MEDSPRSSKRRKIERPAADASSSTPQRAARKPSARLAARNASPSARETPEESTPPAAKPEVESRATKTPKGTRAASRHDNDKEEEIDPYDDFEGAFGSPPTSRKGGSQRTTRSRKAPAKEPFTVHPFKSLNKTQEEQPEETVAEKLKRIRELKAQMALHQENGSLTENNIQQELASENATHTLRARSTPNKGKTSTRRTGTKDVAKAVLSATPKRRGRPPKNRAVQEEKHDTEPDEQLSEEAPQATPSRSRTRNRKAPAQKDVTEEEDNAKDDSDDELAIATPSRSSKRQQIGSAKKDAQESPTSSKQHQRAKARRRNARTDHDLNEDDHRSLSDDDRNGPYVQLHSEDEPDGPSSILDPTEPSPFNPIRKEPAAVPAMQDAIAPGHELDLLRKIVMERITGKRAAPVVGLDKEYTHVHQIVEQTVTAGEGNSILVIGARGSGKTLLVNKVLSEVAKDNPEDFYVVRLNGFIHTDDKIALREIWRQLGKEMEIEEGGIGKNYADTLTTLLALLSHPSEQTGEETEQVARAVIFVMDEFDLFASHPRQTLLYNLFDIAQSRKAPIAVLGLTTRIDVAESLEKRVKSRFSHRHVLLPLAKSFSAFQEICKASLIIEPGDLSVEERAILSSTASVTPSKKKMTKKASANQDVLTEWNSNVSSLFLSKSFLTQTLAPHYYLDKSPATFLTSFLLPTATFNTPCSDLSSLQPPDSLLSLLPLLSTLQLALLIAAARLDIIHDSDTCNFNMAYDEYVSLTSKARIASAAGGALASGSAAKVWGKEVARREWDGLIDLGLVLPVVGGGGGGAGSGFAMVRVDVGLEEIGATIGEWVGVDKTLERWCRMI